MAIRKRKQITITLPLELIEEIDRLRGPVSRSAFIERILREHRRQLEQILDDELTKLTEKIRKLKRELESPLPLKTQKMKRWRRWIASALALAGMWALLGLIAIDVLKSRWIDIAFIAGMGVGVMLAFTIMVVKTLREGGKEE